MNEIDFNGMLNDFVRWISVSAFRLAIGLVFLYLVFKLTNKFTKMLSNTLLRRKFDISFVTFATGALRKMIKLIIFIMFLGYIGFDTAGLAALLATIGVAVGLALQGSLSNLAGGIIIIITRPFKLGDLIESEGQKGTVEAINLFYTNLVTFDNKVAYIPNGNLTNKAIVNYSSKDTRRVDITFSISYLSNYEKAIELIRKVIASNDVIIQDQDPIIRMSAHNNSSIDIFVGVWTQNMNYWDVQSYLLVNVKEEFDNNSIEIPYNQLDIHVHN